MNTETQNPFQPMFPPNETPMMPMPELPETTGKTGRKRNPPAAGKKSTRSAPITRPRKTASKKASAKKPKRGRPAKVVQQGYNETHPESTLVTGKGRAKKQPRATNGLKIELGAAMNAMAGLKQEDATLLGQIVTELLKKPKGARTRIIGALGKVLA